MSRFLVGALKLIAIIFTPIAVMGLLITKRTVSGDQYAAVLEIFGNASRPGAIEIFGADIQTISSLLDFFGAWSLPTLVVISLLGLSALAVSNDRVQSSFHFCLGLFFSFGIWAALLTQSHQRFASIVGSDISDFAGVVITSYLAELSFEILNLVGLLTLVFGVLAIWFWLLLNRRKTRTSKTLN